MPTLLALDTTTDLCSVALIREGALLERVVRAGQTHSQLLLPMIDALLADAGLAPAALDAIAFGAGPGSFTGVRIACGVAQGLGFALDRPLVPVVSLAAMALAAMDDVGEAVTDGMTDGVSDEPVHGQTQRRHRALRPSGSPMRVIACLDARMGEVYHAVYELHDSGCPDRLVERRAPGVYAPAAVPLPEGGGWIGCGSGYSVHAEALRARLGAAMLSRIHPSIVPRAGAVARLAAAAFAAGEAIMAEVAAPLYVRNKVALDVGEQAALRAGGMPRAAPGAGASAGAAVCPR